MPIKKIMAENNIYNRDNMLFVCHIPRRGVCTCIDEKYGKLFCTTGNCANERFHFIIGRWAMAQRRERLFCVNFSVCMCISRNVCLIELWINKHWRISTRRYLHVLFFGIDFPRRHAMSDSRLKITSTWYWTGRLERREYLIWWRKNAKRPRVL
jgi:hypothetical protein